MRQVRVKSVPVLFFPNSNSFGVFSHSKGFRAELLLDSLWFSRADPSWAAKRFRGRFHQGSSKGAPTFYKFRGVSGSLGYNIRLGPPKGSAEGSTKVPSKGAPTFYKFRGVSGSLGQIRLGPPKGSVHQGSSKVSPRFHQGSPSFVVPLVLWGRSVLGCQKVPRYQVTHTPPVSRKRLIMSFLLRYSLGNVQGNLAYGQK